jgi:hypothetical protein
MGTCANAEFSYIRLGRLIRFRIEDVERALRRYTVEEVKL